MITTGHVFLHSSRIIQLLSIGRLLRRPTIFGGHSGGAPPVPISNTEVKPSSADGTALRVWESRTLPNLLKKAQVFGPGLSVV